MRKYSLFILFFLLFFLIISCGNSNNDEWGEKGTVSFINVEGGCWGIISDKGVDYEPTNLEDEYKVNSLRIRFEFEIGENQSSECQTSELVIQITRIEKL